MSWDPYIVMCDYSGYQNLLPVFAVPEDVAEPVDGVDYGGCEAWAVSSNYSKKRFGGRPTPGQMGRLVEVLGEPYWFMDGLGDPKAHYQWYM